MPSTEIQSVGGPGGALSRGEQKVNGLLLTGAMTGPFALMLPALDLAFRAGASPLSMMAGAAMWQVGLLVTGSCTAALVPVPRPSWRHRLLPALMAAVPGLALVLPHPQGALVAAASAALLAAGLLPGPRHRQR